jgi:hypothetical protein
MLVSTAPSVTGYRRRAIINGAVEIGGDREGIGVGGGEGGDVDDGVSAAAVV